MSEVVKVQALSNMSNLSFALLTLRRRFESSGGTRNAMVHRGLKALISRYSQGHSQQSSLSNTSLETSLQTYSWPSQTLDTPQEVHFDANDTVPNEESCLSQTPKNHNGLQESAAQISAVGEQSAHFARQFFDVRSSPDAIGPVAESGLELSVNSWNAQSQDLNDSDNDLDSSLVKDINPIPQTSDKRLDDISIANSEPGVRVKEEPTICIDLTNDRVCDHCSGAHANGGQTEATPLVNHSEDASIEHSESAVRNAGLGNAHSTYLFPSRSVTPLLVNIVEAQDDNGTHRKRTRRQRNTRLTMRGKSAARQRKFPKRVSTGLEQCPIDELQIHLELPSGLCRPLDLKRQLIEQLSSRSDRLKPGLAAHIENFTRFCYFLACPEAFKQLRGAINLARATRSKDVAQHGEPSIQEIVDGLLKAPGDSFTETYLRRYYLAAVRRCIDRETENYKVERPLEDSRSCRSAAIAKVKCHYPPDMHAKHISHLRNSLNHGFIWYALDKAFPGSIALIPEEDHKFPKYKLETIPQNVIEAGLMCLREHRGPFLRTVSENFGQIVGTILRGGKSKDILRLEKIEDTAILQYGYDSNELMQCSCRIVARRS